MIQTIRTTTKLNLLLIFGVFILSLISCSGRYQGYGVILWQSDVDPPRGLENGAVVGVVTISELRDVFGIEPLGVEQPPNQELPRSRVQFFNRLQEAEAFAQEFTPFRDVFAISRTQGLPMREQDDNVSNMVYRLRQGERIKILYRQAEQTDLSGLVSYWYRALTESGIMGWVFGFNLSIIDPNQQEVVQDILARDEALQNFFTNTWRAESFIPMIRNRQFDLNTFSSSYGLFPDFENNSIRLELPGESRVFEFTNIFSPRFGQYQAEGTSLIFTITSPERVVIQYNQDGRIVSRNFVLITEDIDSLVQGELARRQGLLDSILSLGTSFTSTIYGTLTFESNGNFQWQGFETLQSDIIPAGFNGQGRIVFDRHISAALRSEYTGVVSFVPRSGQSWPRIMWLYTLQPDGIRLEHLSTGTGSAALITQRALSPLIMFLRPNQ